MQVEQPKILVGFSFPFDADLTDLILTALPDVRSLQSFALSSKFVYNIFSTRRTSVLRAVVSNYLGVAAPSAMRLSKIMMDVNLYWYGWLSPLAVTKLPTEQDFRPDDPRTVFTMREVHILTANHNVVQELESLYSWRNKDPRSISSLLTPQESERFQTAIYRVWFACALYGRSAPANHVGKSKSKRLSDILDNLRKMQTKFLQSFSASETGPLLEAWNFLESIARWSVRAEFLPQKSA